MLRNSPPVVDLMVVITYVAHDVVTTLGFGCILVKTSDNVGTTLSQRCVSDVVATTKNVRFWLGLGRDVG